MSRLEPQDPGSERGGIAGSGDPRHDPAEGTAEVHSRVTGGGSGYEDPLGSGRSGHSGQSEGARHTFDDLRDRASDLGDRTSEWASRTRRRLDDTLHTVEDRLHLDQAGIAQTIRDNPILAAGIAFGVGFLLAGAPRAGRSGIIGTATGQLRSALLGGLTAAVTQELHDLLDEHGGVAGLVSALGSRDRDSESE
jgi:ElaB/YqjD/DUF883 family membrane-anchored ribosome-binding protein